MPSFLCAHQQIEFTQAVIEQAPYLSVELTLCDIYNIRILYIIKRNYIFKEHFK